MSRNGAGQYSLPNTVNPVVTDTTITSTWANTTLDDIATELTNSLPRDGQAAPTANLPMGGYKLTGLGNGSASTDSVTYGQVFTSPAFTGTPTAPTAAVGTNTTQIATMAALQAAAFAATLPSQTGNSGKSIITDGSTASWGVTGVTGGGTGQSSYTIGDILYASGATTLSKLAASTAGYVLTSGGPGVAPTWAAAGIGSVASVTDSTTLTASSAGYQSGAMTAIGKAFTLPDATTMTVGGPRFILKNDGGYPFGIRNSAGTLVGAVAAGGIAYVTLKDNGSAAGSWSVIGDNLEPGLIGIDNTFSSTYASTVLKPFVALDDNKSIHFLALASGFAAVAVDKTTGAVGTPVTVDATASSVPKSVFKVSSTTAIVFYGASNDTLYGVVVSLSGATTLAVGTAANSGANTNIAVEDFSGAPKIAQLASGLYLVSWATATGAGNTSAMAISVSGTTVTFGSKADIITANNVVNSTTTYALTATTVLVIYTEAAASPYTIKAVVISVSGTTCTVGTPAALGGAAPSLTTAGAPFSCQLSATKALVCSDSGATTNTYVAAITVSGTSVSFGSPVLVESGYSSNAQTYTSNSATRYNPHLFALTSSTALLWYFDGSSISRAVVVTESGGVMSVGPIIYRSFSIAASGNANYGVMLAQGSAEFIGLAQTGTTSAWKNRVIPHKISGTSITYGGSVAASGFSPTQQASGVVATKLSSGNYVIASGLSEALSVLRSNGDSIDNRGLISVPISGGTFAYPLQGVSSNRIVLPCTSLGSSASGTTQLRLLSIEVCA